MYSIRDLKPMSYNKQNYWVRVRDCQTSYVFWGVTSQTSEEPSVSQHMLSSCLAVPQQDLLRPRAQWRPRLWAPCWILCCSYTSAWCCCHCRRILSGKAGRETCAKTRQQATLYGWTHMSRGINNINRKTNRKAHKDRNLSQTNSFKTPNRHVFKLCISSCFQNGTPTPSWAKINTIKSVEMDDKIKATSLF